VIKKWEEKNARNNFSINTSIVLAKNDGKKIVGIKCKKIFFIHTNIVIKKWGEKALETIFPETHE